MHLRGQDWGREENWVRVQGCSTSEPRAGDGVEGWNGKQRFQEKGS